MPSDTSFVSHGDRCAAWHLTAGSDALTGPRGRPCVVMAHGFGATRDCGLLPFAERFAAVGCDVLLFDYRGYADSQGQPRQDVNHWRHRQDYHAAVAAARGLPGGDPERIVVWGTSYSGGHVVAVAARDNRIAAAISQGAAMDGLKALLGVGEGSGGARKMLALGRGMATDLLGAARHKDPRHVPVVGPVGSAAVISAPGAEEGYRKIEGPWFRNEMCGRGLARVAVNRPVTLASKVRCPLLLVVAARDNVAPAESVREAGRRAGALAEVVEYDCSHFDIYTGDLFERSVAAQVDFLRRRLAVPAQDRPQGTTDQAG